MLFRSRQFEQLMIDILNEGRPCARRAPLVEDVLEKTDIRYRHPSIKRRSGARIQVTRTIDQQFHQDKVQHIRRVEEFVVLSPRALAAALDSPEAKIWMPQESVDSFWRSVRPARVDYLAAHLLSLFMSAIAKAGQSPHGPAASVPEALRECVRAYVLHESRRSTSAMRSRVEINPGSLREHHQWKTNLRNKLRRPAQEN